MEIMMPDPDKFERIKTLNSAKDAKIFMERLRKKEIEPVEKSLGETGPFEVWVPSAQVFPALGISAEFDIDVKKREQLKKAAIADERKEVDTVKAVKIAKAALILTGLFILFGVGYYFNKAFVSLSDVGEEIKAAPVKIELNKLKADYKSLIDSGKELHSKKSKWSLGSLIFSWNLSKAEKAFKDGRFDVARVKLEKCFRKDSENPAIISLLLTTYLKLSLRDRAKILLKGCYGMPSGGYEWKQWTVLQLADIYLMEKNYFGAEYELGELLKINPDDVQVLKKLAEAKTGAGDLSRAAEYLKKVLHIDGKETGARIFLGNILFRLRVFNEADWHLSNVYEKLNTVGEMEETSLIIAEANLHLGRYARAKEYLAQAELIGKSAGRSSFLKAVYNYLTGDYSGSKEILLKVLEARPDFTLAGLYLNLITLRGGESGTAQDFLDGISEKCNSEDEKALLHYNLACLLLRKDALNKAWDELMFAYQYDKCLFRKFTDDPLIRKIKTSKKYSELLRQQD